MKNKEIKVIVWPIGRVCTLAHSLLVKSKKPKTDCKSNCKLRARSQQKEYKTKQNEILNENHENWFNNFAWIIVYLTLFFFAFYFLAFPFRHFCDTAITFFMNFKSTIMRKTMCFCFRFKEIWKWSDKENNSIIKMNKKLIVEDTKKSWNKSELERMFATRNWSESGNTWSSTYHRLFFNDFSLIFGMFFQFLAEIILSFLCWTNLPFKFLREQEIHHTKINDLNWCNVCFCLRFWFQVKCQNVVNFHSFFSHCDFYFSRLTVNICRKVKIKIKTSR